MTEKNRILIVDDSLDIQFLLKQMLDSEGYQITFACSGTEALEMLRETPVLPDLILLDLMMPELDGYQFREAQAKDSSISAIPVIVMSADGGMTPKKEKLAAHAFLKKPFLSPEEILNTVERVLGS
jgi:CheY-like chemotaxis protein